MVPAFPPAANTASEVTTELRAVFRAMKRRLREHGVPHDMPPSQIAVLQHLEEGPATVSALARTEGMRPQSMSAIAAALLEAGLVRAAADPNDGRQTLLSLTKKYRNWMERSRAARQDWLSHRIEARLSAKERATLAAALALIRRVIEN